MLTARESALCLKDPGCADPECRRRTATLPVGKFKGERLSWVYELDPGYVAWFHETVEGYDEVKAAIRALDGIEAHLTAFREKRQPSSQKRLSATQQEIEWLMEQFSVMTVDKACKDLFDGA